MRARDFIVEAKTDAAAAVMQVVAELISEGHTEVSPDVITAKVSAALGHPFMLKDLVAANNSSPELQNYISSINPSKIKFSTDILTVKNESPVKQKVHSQNTVSSMASRAANRPRLGESSAINESGETYTWVAQFDDGSQEKLNITSDEVPTVKGIFAKRFPNKQIAKVTTDWRPVGSSWTGASTPMPDRRPTEPFGRDVDNPMVKGLEEGNPVNVDALLSRSDRSGKSGPWWARTGDVNYMGDHKDRELKYRIYFPLIFSRENHYLRSNLDGDERKLLDLVKQMKLEKDDDGQWYFPVYKLSRATRDELTRAKYYFGEKIVRVKVDKSDTEQQSEQDLDEGLKNPKDNPCWKGYYPVGTKKKGGRTVPNCVPKPKK